jgi:hypothetical protein
MSKLWLPPLPCGLNDMDITGPHPVANVDAEQVNWAATAAVSESAQRAMRWSIGSFVAVRVGP